MDIKNAESKELIEKAKTARSVIVVSVQTLPGIENRFSKKRVMDGIEQLGQLLTEVEDELADRGIFLTD